MKFHLTQKQIWIIGLVAVLLLATGLRTYSALTEAVEVDEIFTRDVVSSHWRTAVVMILDDRYHPPLHYLLAKILSVVSGKSPLGLRFISVLSGICLVASVAFVTRALLADVGLALLAAALVALSDWQILVSHFARPYSFLDLLVLVAGILLWKACQYPLDTRIWLAYWIVGSAIVHTNYLAWLYLISPVLVVVWCGAEVRKRWLLATGGIAASLLPWTILLFWYARTRGGFMNKFTALDFRPGSGALVNAFAQFNGLPAQTLWTVGLTVLLGGVFCALAIARAIRNRSVGRNATESMGVLIMASLALLTPCLLWLISVPPIALPFWGIRHLTPSIAPWVLVVCAGVSVLRPKAPWFQLTVATSLIVLQGVATITNTLESRFLPYHKMVNFIASSPATAGPIFSLCEPTCGLLRYYLPPGQSTQPFPSKEADLPFSYWLVYSPLDSSQSFQVERIQKSGWSLAIWRDYFKRVGTGGVVRAAMLVKKPNPYADGKHGG